MRLLALAPPSFALVFAYSEALYLTLAVAVFLLAGRQRWWCTAAAGYLAGLTRPVGRAAGAAGRVHGLAGPVPAGLGAVAAAVAPVAGAATFLLWAAGLAR